MSLGNQYGDSFFVQRHQHGRRDVIWKEHMELNKEKV